MIPRYSRPEMASLWAPETRFRIWFAIESHAAAAMGDAAQVPTQWVLDAAATTEPKHRASKRRGNLPGVFGINGPHRNFVELHLIAVLWISGDSRILAEPK